MRILTRILLVLFSMFIMLGPSSQSHAQNIPGLTLSPSEGADGNDAVQVIIIDKAGQITVADSSALVDQNTSEDASVGSALMRAQMKASSFRENLRKKIERLPDVINEVEYILRVSSPDGTLSAFIQTLYYMAIFLVLGYIFETRIFGRYVAKGYVVARIRKNPQGYLEKLPFLVFRFFAGVVGTLISIAVAYFIGYMIFGTVNDTAIEFTVTIVFWAYFAFRVISLVWRMVLSPYLPQYRIPYFSDTDAKRLFVWMNVAAFVGIAMDMFATWMLEISLNQSAYGLTLVFGTTLVAIINLLLIAFNRRAITAAICGDTPWEELSSNLKLISVLWTPVAVIYILYSVLLIIYSGVMETQDTPPLIAGAYGAMMSAFVVFGIAGYLIERYQAARYVALEDETPEASEGPVEQVPDGALISQSTGDALSSYTIHTWQELAFRVAGILALSAGLWTGLSIWEISPDLLDSSIFGRLLDVAFVLLVGYIAYQAFRIWVDNKIAEETPLESEAEMGDEGGEVSVSRLGTLLPLFRHTIMVIIVITVVLIALMEFGVNVTPLFAGAGVVGIAVGFGAQALVRDIFSGAFFLIDDAFRKGEYIDVGDVKGTVESISIRSFKLRHHLGPLHTIPFGEIKSLTNFSRDWVIMKLKLRLTYDTDVEKVRKLIKKLGIALLDDPVIGKDFLQPLKSQGVIEMQDSAMIVRVKFMTKPGDQWMVRKRVFQEIRELFEREGIKFANREVTVHIADARGPGAPPLSEADKKAVAGAALDVEDGMEPPAGGGDDR